jgi:hypothetical protein
LTSDRARLTMNHDGDLREPTIGDSQW